MFYTCQDGEARDFYGTVMKQLQNEKLFVGRTMEQKSS